MPNRSEIYATEEEALAAAKAYAEEQGLVDFDGMNCDDYVDIGCGGWDGVSRRCECTNRRVYWATEQCSDGMWRCWAEAY